MKHLIGRNIAAGLGAAVAAAAAVHLVSCITIDRVIENLQIEYSSHKINLALDGFTIAFLTDIHFMSAEKLCGLVDAINSRHVDVMLIGGDFPRGALMMRVFDILSGVKPLYGSYGVAGNHDNPARYFRAMTSYGITPLANTGVRIRDNLMICGVEDLKRGRPDVCAAAAGAKAEDVVVLLSHNPDTLLMQDTGIPDIALSGHTHGGYITLFGLYSPLLSLTKHVTAYGHKLKSGWIRTPAGTDLFVSNGLGCHRYMPRVFARPQLVYMTLKKAKA